MPSLRMIRPVAPPTRKPGLFDSPPEPEGTGDARPLRVSEACGLIKRALGGVNNGRPILVEGEISDFKAVQGSGHWYFALKDADGGSALNCAFFRQRRTSTSGPPAPGAAVVLEGTFDYYAPFGKLSFIVSRMLERGKGNLHEQYERLRAELQQSGYFDESVKVPLPVFPRRIAMLTSPDGAVRHDIAQTARGRWPGIELLLVPIPVQGEHAAPRIASAIRAVRRSAASLGLDAIILARGGGSLEDLWAFNERVVADAIHQSREEAISRGDAVPLVSAIGHESDFTIADFASDFRASTPTQAAMHLVRSAEEESEYLSSALARLATLERNLIRHARTRLDASIRHPSIRRPAAMLEPHRRRIDDAARELVQELRNQLGERERRVSGLERRLVAASPRASIVANRAALDARLVRISRAVEVRVERARRRISASSRTLDAVGPQQVLARGYSITLDDAGGIVRDPALVKAGDLLQTRLESGTLHSRAIDAENDGVRDVDPKSE